MNYLLACLIAYLIGMIPVSPMQNMLIQADRSAFRTFRLVDVLPVIVLEIIKGAVAVVIAWLIAGVVAAHLAVIFVVLGALCPFIPFHYQSDGWGVAAGALLVISPIMILISLLIFLLSLFITRYFLWSTCLAVIAFLICLILFAAHVYVWLVAIGVIAMLSIQRPHFWKRKGWYIPWWRK